MGILNTTPDSFYDGGKYVGLDAAVARAVQMIEEGADIIDIGGESTGPGSKEISLDEERKRVIPVIKAMSGQPGQVAVRTGQRLTIDMSVDTYRSNVAEDALNNGATIVNDVTAGRGDPAMLPLIGERGCTYIMMRSKDDSARTTIDERLYDDVLETIHAFFEERIAAAEAAGIKRSQMIVDPGLGHFVSSDPTYSWHILEHLEFLHDFGCRILVSPSRKSFTADFPGQATQERLPGTLKATALALEHGASIIRTHDVRETKEFIERGNFAVTEPSSPKRQ